MPIGLDPNETFDTWLHSDDERPEKTRPTFDFRYLTARVARRWRAMLADEDANRHAEAKWTELADQIAGWRNMVDPRTGRPIAFDPADPVGSLQAVLTEGEAWELMGRAACNLSPADMVRFASPSLSSSAGPATGTDPKADAAPPPGGPDARTPPPPPSH